MIRQYELLTRADHPDLSAAADAAILAFAEPGPAFVCPHILDGTSPGILLCTQHPRVGLLCGKCSERHLHRHDREEEFRCDRCRSHSDTMVGIGLSYLAHGIPVRSPRGRRAKLTGTICLMGLGLCPTCAQPPTRAAAS